MGPACFLIIHVSADGVFLYRYDARGECVGDTWHMNIDDAQHQAEYEYGDRAQGWMEIPSEIEDAVAFGMTQAKTNG